MNSKEAAQERVLREHCQAIEAERVQLVATLERVINETGARLRLLMALAMISKETFEILADNLIANQALRKMRPLFQALESLPPLTPITAPVLGTTITIPPELAEAIDQYLTKGGWDDPKPDEFKTITQLAALNAVAFIGERLIGLYALAKGASQVTSPVTPPT